MQPTCHNFGPTALRSKRCVAPVRCQIFRSQKFRGATSRKKVPKANLGRGRFQRHAANEATSPQFLATRVASETPRGALVSRKFPHLKFSRPKLAKASSRHKPLMQATCHNLGPSALGSKRCVAPMRCHPFPFQNLRGATPEKKVPKANLGRRRFQQRRERSCPTTSFGQPRRERNAASRPCCAKISASAATNSELRRCKGGIEVVEVQSHISCGLQFKDV